MVGMGGAAVAQQVLHEVTVDVVRLMVHMHADGHMLIKALVQYLTHYKKHEGCRVSYALPSNALDKERHSAKSLFTEC